MGQQPITIQHSWVVVTTYRDQCGSARGSIQDGHKQPLGCLQSDDSRN